MEESKFFLCVSGEDGMVITVADDVNRPNNPNVNEVLELWIENNFGNRSYEYWKLDTCE